MTSQKRGAQMFEILHILHPINFGSTSSSSGVRLYTQFNLLHAILREEHRLWAFENTVLRRKFGSKMMMMMMIIQFNSLLLMCLVNSKTPITEAAQCKY
jgi:hypothetical protein